MYKTYDRKVVNLLDTKLTEFLKMSKYARDHLSDTKLKILESPKN